MAPKLSAFDSRDIHAIMKQSLPADVDGGGVGQPPKVFLQRVFRLLSPSQLPLSNLTDRLIQNPNLKVPAQFSLIRITVWIT